MNNGSVIPETEYPASTAGYTGLYGFHKYWGKKPAEPIRFLINNLTDEKDLVVDPFLGSGISAKESLVLKRRFIGFDINPFAIRLSHFLINPPSFEKAVDSFSILEKKCKLHIQRSYMSSGQEASHFLWENQTLKEIWFKDSGRIQRDTNIPDSSDLELYNSFARFKTSRLRKPVFFTNSRINSKAHFSLENIFTQRALRNIEILLSGIDELPAPQKEAMLLTLTASAGQMSKMVFAITGRGKKTGTKANKIEVGSWVIGYWCPKLHFEVNAWNCFETRFKKLLKSLKVTKLYNFKRGSLEEVCKSKADFNISLGSCISLLKTLPDNSTRLVITDPPHGDRIPYLELSELWNVILGEEPVFEDEIVVSNAKERKKSVASFNEAISCFLNEVIRVLTSKGTLVLIFNSKKKENASFFSLFLETCLKKSFNYAGFFPIEYSTGSVVQDNRKGALKNDLAIVFSRSSDVPDILSKIPTFTRSLPCFNE